MNQVILDVRESDEYQSEHIAGSIHVPLSRFAALAPGVLNDLQERNLLIMCRGGNRARMAKTQLDQLGYGDRIQCEVYDGGILRWKKEGRPVVTRKKGHLPVLRQVQIIAGFSVLASSLVAAFLSPGAALVAAFFGAGIFLAGVSGNCALATWVEKLPWNRGPNAAEQEN